MKVYADTFTHVSSGQQPNKPFNDDESGQNGGLTSDDFLLDSVLTGFMENKYELYATWMGLAWGGVPLMFLNDNYYAVASYDGSNPNWG